MNLLSEKNFNQKMITELLRYPKKIYVLAAGGIGMRGLIELLLARSHQIFGTDQYGTHLKQVKERGVILDNPNDKIAIQCAMKNSDLIIYSSAIKPTNELYQMAEISKKPMFRRAEILTAFMKYKHKNVVIAGMHGKTTTTAMLAYLMRYANYQPSYYVGADIPCLGAPSYWDQKSDFFIVEGDESDGTLAWYESEYALLLNIDNEHLDFYKNSTEIENVFSKFLSQTREKIYYFNDLNNYQNVISNLNSQSISIGINSNSEYYLQDFQQIGWEIKFSVFYRDQYLGSVEMTIPGFHNAKNALMVIAFALDMGIDFSVIVAGLKQFHTANRRLEIKYHQDDIMLIDDYGHHPTEVLATITAVRHAFPTKKINLIFQPHRYTRTAYLMQEFVQALKNVDQLFLVPIYGAGEYPIDGVSSNVLVQELNKLSYDSVRLFDSIQQASELVTPLITTGDVVITMGAGSIWTVGEQIAHKLSLKKEIEQSMSDNSSVKISVPLAKYTTLGIGGSSQFFVEPITEEGFINLLTYCREKKIALKVIGRGSNLLIADSGFPGVIVRLVHGKFVKYHVHENKIYAGVGVKLKQIVMLARKFNLSGFEWMDGIPGTVGGSLRMNAGSMGYQMFDNMEEVRLINPSGKIIVFGTHQIKTEYRNVPLFRDHYALSVSLIGIPSKSNIIEDILQKNRSYRKEKQPSESSAGCIFKNPIGRSAGEMIDSVGLKNFSIGDARVSDIHANFIVNDGSAQAKDILSLIDVIQTRVEQKYGFQLELEIEVVA